MAATSASGGASAVLSVGGKDGIVVPKEWSAISSDDGEIVMARPLYNFMTAEGSD